MYRWQWGLVALTALVACEPEAEAGLDPPEAVAPEEVPTGGGTETASAEPDVAALQARVAELEGQLAECRGDATPSTAAGAGGPTSVVPEGVGTPEPGGAPARASAARESPSRRRASSSARQPGLLGALLGAPEGDARGDEDDGASSGGAGREGDADEDSRTSAAPLNPVDLLLGPN